MIHLAMMFVSDSEFLVHFYPADGVHWHALMLRWSVFIVTDVMGRNN
jgi:hypothetical protein